MKDSISKKQGEAIRVDQAKDGDGKEEFGFAINLI